MLPLELCFEHDHRVCARNSGELAQGADQTMQRLCITRADLDHQRVASRDVMAFEHLGHPHHRLFEASDASWMIDSDPDERTDVEPESPRIDHRVIADDQSRLFEFAHTLEHGWRRETHALAELRERLFAVILECVEQRTIDGVQSER